MSQDLQLANPGLSQEELDVLIAARRRRRWIVAGIIVVLVVLPALGWFGWKFYEHGPSAQNHYELALAHEARGDLQSASIELKNTLKKQPANAQARLRLGQIYLELGNPAAAQKELEQARGLEEAAEEVELGLLRVKLLQLDFDAVLAGLESLSSRRSPALLLKGDVMLALRRIPQAGAAYEALLAIDSEHIDALLGMARVLMARDDVEAADRRLSDALRISETNFRTWTTKGDIASARQDHEQAKVAYERALELRGGDVGARVSLTRALLELGQTEEADRYLSKLYKAFPGQGYSDLPP